MTNPGKTIAAISTPAGKGGIGIVRVSGPAVPEITQAFFGYPLKSRQARLHAFKDVQGETLDRGIALYFEAPNSYTGEDVLELQAHGGPVLLDLLLQRILALGAVPAAPGEFTERAFLNHKIDLTQAEAVADLIESSSEQAVRAAARSLEGRFSKTVNELLSQLTYLRTYIEAALDFPEEEIDFLNDTTLREKLDQLREKISETLQATRVGFLLKEGMKVVILGLPNAGKSRLLNRLAGRDAAIVTDIAGTTRDVLREHIHIDGLPLHIVDTAGLRDNAGIVEQEGIKRAWREVETADRVFLLIDDCIGMTPADRKIMSELPGGVRVDIIYNKLDISGRSPYIKEAADHTELGLSAHTGAGIDLLTRYLKTAIGAEQTMENTVIARRRHIEALLAVQKHADIAKQQLEAGAGELAAEELSQAQSKLSSITGEFSSDELLGQIFSSFCIGK